MEVDSDIIVDEFQWIYANVPLLSLPLGQNNQKKQKKQNKNKNFRNFSENRSTTWDD